MRCTEFFTVDSHDVDFNSVCKASAIVRFMQEAAGAHLALRGTSNAKLRESGRAFLLSRFSAGFYHAVHPYERLEVQTWACESRGYSFNRCYRVLRDGQVVAEASSVWALVDIKTRKPIRTSDFEVDLLPEDMLALDLPPRITCPKDMCLRGEHIVSYADLDENNHMNNTRYSDMLCDTIDMQGKRIYRLSINFMNEARYHDALNIYAVEQKEDILFRAVRPDGKTNIEAQITLGEI